MEITAKQARELMNRKQKDLPKKVREELDDIFSLIERAAIKRYFSIYTLKISDIAIKYLEDIGYIVSKKERDNDPTLICW